MSETAVSPAHDDDRSLQQNRTPCQSSWKTGAEEAPDVVEEGREVAHAAQGTNGAVPIGAAASVLGEGWGSVRRTVPAASGMKEAMKADLMEVVRQASRPAAQVQGWAGSAAKRGLDSLVSSLALALSIPFWAVIGLAILLDDGWPILYCQRRVGRGGRVFRVYKFRSMCRDAERYTSAVLAEQDDPRITGVGRILRKAALDEIPQLVNIFKGDMSWVGPRPERPEFVSQFLQEIPGYGLRHGVRPGLTGMAQVYGGYHTEAAGKLEYDLAYLRCASPLLDFRLFVKSWLNTATARWGPTEDAR
jgi:lipopolysaccharide/colanic/teichoic acid biosynthesis glycosyltransferase